MARRSRFWGKIILGIAVLLLCAYARTAAIWARYISLPVLHVLRRLSGALPISVLEWGAVGLACAAALLLLLRRYASFGRLCRRTASALAIALVTLWLPLYALPTDLPASPTAAQLGASCESLIDALNAAAPDFSSLPDDLPAKTAAFPEWMRLFRISGFFAFPTGEALVSPELAPAAVPFVSVHESMHALGIAGEGAANIAAWEECMRRGGAYADSARLYALGYSLEALRVRDRAAYARCLRGMNAQTRALYHACGGNRGHAVSPAAVRAVFAMAGVADDAENYEILAAYLASQTHLCYNASNDTQGQ